MASMTIPNIEDQLKARLRVRAAEHGRLMEDEGRDILRTALAAQESPPSNLATSIRARMAAVGGVRIEIAPRQPIRDPVDFAK